MKPDPRVLFFGQKKPDPQKPGLQIKINCLTTRRRRRLAICCYFSKFH